MAATPNFAGTPRTAFAQISAANTARDGTGTLVTVITGAANGTRVDDIEIVATGTADGVVRLFLHDGTTARLWREVLVAPTTPSNTTRVWSAQLAGLGLVLQNSNWSLRASTQLANTFNVLVTRAGDF